MARSNNNNKLKAFVRFDGSGRIVSSSLIVQAFKPKVGNYKEIDAKECCNPTRVELLFTPVIPINYPGVTIYCDEVNVAYQYVNDGTSITTLDGLVNALNANAATNQFGTYSNAGGGVLKLTVSFSVQNNLCPNGTLAFTVYSD